MVYIDLGGGRGVRESPGSFGEFRGVRGRAQGAGLGVRGRFFDIGVDIDLGTLAEATGGPDLFGNYHILA